jgi:hypothetical protein
MQRGWEPSAIGVCAGDAVCLVDLIRKPCGDRQQYGVASTTAQRCRPDGSFTEREMQRANKIVAPSEPITTGFSHYRIETGLAG